MKWLVRQVTGNRCRHTWIVRDLGRLKEVRCTRMAGHSGKHIRERCL